MREINDKLLVRGGHVLKECVLRTTPSSTHKLNTYFREVVIKNISYMGWIRYILLIIF